MRGDRDGSGTAAAADAIGWLFLATAACLFLSTDGGGYAFLTYRLGRHLALGPLGLVLGQLRGPGLVLLFVVILFFPDGRLPSRFWRATLGSSARCTRCRRWQRPWRSLLPSPRILSASTPTAGCPPLKWLASGAAVTLVCGTVSGALSASGMALVSVVANDAWFGWAALPVSIGVAILRYRLYDIDLLHPHRGVPDPAELVPASRRG